MVVVIELFYSDAIKGGHFLTINITYQFLRAIFTYLSTADYCFMGILYSIFFQFSQMFKHCIFKNTINQE